jgi:hypothetical protein
VWTKAAETALRGSTTLVTHDEVDYKAGDHIVITSSSLDYHETEELVVVSVAADGHTVTFTPPLQYDHTALIYEFEGESIDMRCEVGLMSRNVIIQGDDSSAAQMYGSTVIAASGGILRYAIVVLGCGLWCACCWYRAGSAACFAFVGLFVGLLFLLCFRY